ncbi:hypothetical protein GRF59_05980 [Paenibacillus sp. HJL G12]|uniref:Uncharacterized protein n=1 Tax=Paenibacillus dendrobii TaxID=2691084 RepID=A0A7X3LHF4_9BACL|nr:hypothetical protein [Paenibacillus dendrobii]MWV43174.1 hypothetical protein [Paenibacillus dendrobii]
MWMYALVIGVAVLALITTFLVGFSAENKKKNPNYEKKTKSNITRLTSIYAVTIILAIVAFVAVSLN